MTWTPEYRTLKRAELMLPTDEIWVQRAWHRLDTAHAEGLTRSAPGRHVGAGTPPIRRKLADEQPAKE